MNTVEPKIELVLEWFSKTRCRVSVTAAGRVLHMDALNPAVASARAKFASAITNKYPGIDPDRLDDELMALATRGPTDLVKGDDALQEVDISLVVRPELFHTVSVSGITVPVVIGAGGTLVPRWRTHLR